MKELEFYADHFEGIAKELDFSEKERIASMGMYQFKLAGTNNSTPPEYIERLADKLIMHRDKARECNIQAKLYRDVALNFRHFIELANSK